MLRFQSGCHRTTLVACIVLTLGVLHTGCSALIDSSLYVGGGGDGGGIDAAGTDGGPPRDGAIDGAVDPQAPSAPVVDLSPPAPLTDDPIVVAITTESVDPLGGTVTYEIRWLRGGVVIAGETGMTLPATATSRDDVIRVEVTPVAGALRGAAGTDEVTIGNTLPVLSTVGFESYRPIVGEPIRALTGPVTDRDGDASGLRYAWLRNDVPVAGAVGSTLVTTGFAAGDLIRVEAWANDGADGPRVSAGPIVVLSDAMRWRPLLPNTAEQIGGAIYDEPHRRVLRFSDGLVWEQTLADDGSMRTAALAPSGPGPASGELQIVMHDPINRRMLTRDRSDPTALFALDLTVRGGETWTRTIPGGAAPPALMALPTIYADLEHDRIWLINGFTDSTGAYDTLYSLDVATPGSESWRLHTTTGSPMPAMFGAAIATDPTSPSRVYLFGGVQDPGPSPTIRRAILQLDLTNTVVTVTPLAAELPAELWGAGAFTDGARILVVGGASTFGPGAVPRGVSAFNPATMIVTTVAAGTADAYFLPTLMRDVDMPADVLVLTYGGGITDADGLYLRFLRFTAAGALTTIFEDSRPRIFGSASATIDGSIIWIIGGRDGRGAARTDQWQIDAATLRWTPLVTMPDGVSAMSPAARYGVIGATGRGTFGGGELVQLGGQLDSSTAADMQVWELQNDRRWIHHTLAGSGLAPTPRTGVTTFPSNCGGSVIGYFGGEAGGALLADTAEMSCPGTGRLCTWSAIANGGVVQARSHAAAILEPDTNQVWMFGGRIPTGPSNQVFGYDVCSGSPAWAVVAPSGTVPLAREEHSFTLVPSTTGGSPVAYAFGGRGMDGNSRNDIHRLVLLSETSARWEAVVTADTTVPGIRSGHLAFHDSTRRRLLLIGGQDRNDVWELLLR